MAWKITPPDVPTNNPSPITHTTSADLAVRKVFAIIGVDIDRPESLEEFREDLRFCRKLRKAFFNGFLALVAVGIAGLGGALWLGVASKFFKE